MGKGGFEGVLEGQLGVGRWLETWICRLGGMEGIPEIYILVAFIMSDPVCGRTLNSHHLCLQA